VIKKSHKLVIPLFLRYIRVIQLDEEALNPALKNEKTRAWDLHMQEKRTYLTALCCHRNSATVSVVKEPF
jgi:hypothetical protein